MKYAYQNSTISQILEAILEQTTFTGTSNSNIADILLSILYNTPYDEEPKSVLAELFLKLKAKIENEPFEPYDKEPKSVLAEILLSILNETEYTKPATSRIGELLLQLKEELEKYAEVTVSGAICNFNTSLVKPLVNLKAYFEATQEAGTPTPQSPKAISGVSAVNVIHSNKNLLNPNYFTNQSDYYVVNNDGSITVKGVDGRAWSALNAIPMKKGTYTFSRNVQKGTFQIRSSLNDYASNLVSDSTLFRSFTLSDDCFIKIKLDVGATGEYPITDTFQIELGSSATSIEPYNGSTTLINLGGTYYGGYVEQDKDGHRKLVLTKAIEVFNGSENWALTYANRFRVNRQPNFSVLAGDNSYNVVSCNMLAYEVVGDSTLLHNNCFTWFSSTNNLFVRAEDITNLDDFKALLNQTNLVVEGILAEPIEIDLPDGEPIITFNGDNNIYNDSANTEVTYLTTINDNINRAVTVKRQQDRLKELEKEALKPKDEVIVEEPKPIEKELKK